MVVKDWMTEAADELASHFSFGGGRDSYVTDEQRSNVARNYAAIIAKHSPFKEGVAYMPVPRCETCVHYDNGRCNEVRPHIGRLRVAPDFGCVRWEAKRCSFIMSIMIDGEEKQCSIINGHEGHHEWKAEF